MGARPETPPGDLFSELDEALSGSNHRGRFGCVEKAITEHPDQTDLILGAVAHPAPASMTSRFLEKHGIKLTHGAISRHRRGDCTCKTR